MDSNKSVFGKCNFVICLVAVALILAGFILMAGKGTTIEHGFQPEIFSSRRIVIAPTVSLVGFLLLIVGILFPSKTN